MCPDAKSDPSVPPGSEIKCTVPLDIKSNCTMCSDAKSNPSVPSGSKINRTVPPDAAITHNDKLCENSTHSSASASNGNVTCSKVCI